MVLYILRMIIDKEETDTHQRLEFVNSSLFDIEMLWPKGIHYLSKQ